MKHSLYVLVCYLFLKHDVSETGSVSVFFCFVGGKPTQKGRCERVEVKLLKSVFHLKERTQINNQMLTRIFGPEKEDAAVARRELETRSFIICSLHIILLELSYKGRRDWRDMQHRWGGEKYIQNVNPNTWRGEITWKPKRKSQDIEVDLKDVRCKIAAWIQLTQGRISGNL